MRGRMALSSRMQFTGWFTGITSLSPMCGEQVGVVEGFEVKGQAREGAGR
jgi:hypothetical protein